jgi:hypothetical protein
MKTVAYLTTYSALSAPVLTSSDPVRAAAQSAAEKLGAVLVGLNDVDDEAREFGPPADLWTFLADADVVLANVEERDPPLFYRLGVAVGMRKQLVVVLQDRYVLPFDFRGATVIEYESRSRHFEELLAFKIEEGLREVFRRKRSSVTPHGSTRYGSRRSAGFRRFNPREFTGTRGEAFGRKFEEWFATVVGQVSSWELLTEKGSDRGYDLVVWNNSGDTALSVLGNPIAIELKAAKRLSKSTLDQIATLAKVQGLKGVILGTTAPLSADQRQHVLDLARSTGVILIVLDRDDLATLNNPEDFLHVVERRIIENWWSSGR